MSCREKGEALVLFRNNNDSNNKFFLVGNFTNSYMEKGMR
jgi:hypothetical protein